MEHGNLGGLAGWIEGKQKGTTCILGVQIPILMHFLSPFLVLGGGRDALFSSFVYIANPIGDHPNTPVV